VYVPEVKQVKTMRDTLRIKDDDGRELLLMKAVRDKSSGSMVATETLDAAKVTARFRNIAERHGKLDLAFSIIVPAKMQDSKWQLRFYPNMYILGDVERLDPVLHFRYRLRQGPLQGLSAVQPAPVPHRFRSYPFREHPCAGDLPEA
jgi:hypothetical protein